MPRFSILIPAYKSAFLQEAIASVLSQTYADLELIISDDCSPEPIKAICSPFLKDCRVKYRSNEKNMGAKNLSAHWNLLLQYATGEYVIVPGDDDVFEPNYLEEVSQVIDRYPDIDLIRARTRRIDQNGDELATDPQMMSRQGQSSFIEFLSRWNTIHCMGNLCFKKSALLEKGGFVNFDLAWFSDDASAIVYIVKDVGHTHDVVFNFRVSRLSISSSTEKQDKFAKVKSMLSFIDWYKEQGGEEGKIITICCGKLSHIVAMSCCGKKV